MMKISIKSTCFFAVFTAVLVAKSALAVTIFVDNNSHYQYRLQNYQHVGPGWHGAFQSATIQAGASTSAFRVMDTSSTNNTKMPISITPIKGGANTPSAILNIAVTATPTFSYATPGAVGDYTLTQLNTSAQYDIKLHYNPTGSSSNWWTSPTVIVICIPNKEGLYSQQCTNPQSTGMGVALKNAWINCPYDTDNTYYHYGICEANLITS